MATVEQTRADVAAAVNAADATLRVRVRSVKTPRPLDGWVIVGRVFPGPYRTECVYTVLVLLAAEQDKADERFSALAVPLVDALTKGVLHPSDVAAEPVTVLVGDAPMFALALTLTLEVD